MEILRYKRKRREKEKKRMLNNFRSTNISLKMFN